MFIDICKDPLMAFTQYMPYARLVILTENCNIATMLPNDIHATQRKASAPVNITCEQEGGGAVS